jgi:hypothetical protein
MLRFLVLGSYIIAILLYSIYVNRTCYDIWEEKKVAPIYIYTLIMYNNSIDSVS